MRLALFSPSPMYRPVGMLSRLRFGADDSKTDGGLSQPDKEEGKPFTTCRTDEYRNRCQGRCYECDYGKTIRNPRALERMRLILQKLNSNGQ